MRHHCCVTRAWTLRSVVRSLGHTLAALNKLPTLLRLRTQWEEEHWRARSEGVTKAEKKTSVRRSSRPELSGFQREPSVRRAIRSPELQRAGAVENCRDGAVISMRRHLPSCFFLNAAIPIPHSSFLRVQFGEDLYVNKSRPKALLNQASALALGEPIVTLMAAIFRVRRGTSTDTADITIHSSGGGSLLCQTRRMLPLRSTCCAAFVDCAPALLLQSTQTTTALECFACRPSVSSLRRALLARHYLKPAFSRLQVVGKWGEMAIWWFPDSAWAVLLLLNWFPGVEEEYAGIFAEILDDQEPGVHEQATASMVRGFAPSSKAASSVTTCTFCVCCPCHPPHDGCACGFEEAEE